MFRTDPFIGWPGDGKIWVRSDLSDKEAAATLFHEAFHTIQSPIQPQAAEIEAWEKEQEFRLRHKIPVNPEWLNKDKSVKQEVMKNDVEAKYEHLAPSVKEKIEFIGQEVTGKKQLKDWKCKTTNEKP